MGLPTSYAINTRWNRRWRVTNARDIQYGRLPDRHGWLVKLRD